MNMQRITSALLFVAAMMLASPTMAADARAGRTLSPAGQCTQFLLRWSNGYDNDQSMEYCSEFMGFNKYCAERDSYVVIGYIDAPGTWQGTRRTLECTPNHHDDSIGEQFIKIWEGIGEGLLTAAPFVAEGVLGVTCVYGQIYACAVLALQISEQAGAKIPGEVGKVLYIVNKAPQCINGDVVACAYLGVHGANLVGLEIPGVPVIQIIVDQKKCTDGEFAACVRLGKAAADAGGIETGALTGSIIDAQACLDGNKDTCWKLAKQAITDHVPLKGVPGAAEDIAACNHGDPNACHRAGKQIAATALGLVVDTPTSAPFGANACVSAVIAKGPVDLASAWQDYQSTSVAVFPSDGSRFGAPTTPSVRNGGWAATAKWAAADYNNDGKTDLLAAWNDGGNNTLTVRQSNGAHLTPVHWAIRAGTWVDTTVWLPGDFNGDGRMDIAGIWDDQGLTSIAVYLSNGTRFAAPTQWNTRDGGWSDGVKWVVGDFDGDRKDDIVAIWENGGSNTITVRQSTGSRFAASHWASNAGGWLETTTWLAGDFNGDGRLDLAAAWHDGNETSIAVYASDGHRFPGWNQWSSRGGGWIDDAKWTSGDFNGDGKADVAAIWNNGGTNTMTVRQSTGSSFVPAHWASNSGGWSPTAAWCVGKFPAPAPPNPLERADDHTASLDLFKNAQANSVSQAAESDRITDSATAAAPTVKAQARVRGADGPTTALPTTAMSICGNASAAAARGSPAAPGLKQQCLASGGFLVLEPPLAAADLDALALQGGPIVDGDPELSARRALQSGDAGMRGFDIGVAAAGRDTAPGPGKQRIYNSLARDEKPGYDAAVSFVLERNRR